MRMNRRFLYWGIFLVALGSVLVAADLRAVDTATLTDGLRLWPLAVIALGLSLVLRRTRLSVPGLLLAAALPGLVLGSVVAVAPTFVGDCGGRDQVPSVATTQGAFDGPATVSIRSGCGSLNVTTAPGSSWRLDAGSTSGRTPGVDATARSLSIDGTRRDGDFLNWGRDSWDLTLPTSAIDDLSLVAFASQANVSLPSAQVSRLSLTVDASDVVVDASEAAIADVSAVVNVGALAIDLPGASDLVGSLRVGAGAIRVCTPAGLGLRVSSTGTAGAIRVNGLQQQGSEWQSSDYTSATHRADLGVSATFGAVDLNPIGGCK